MTLPADISTRIYRADQIATDAISTAQDMNELFTDLSNIRPSIFIPNEITAAVPPVVLTDNPVAPGDARVNAAAAALASMPTEIAELSALKAQIDNSLSVFNGTFAEVQARLPQILALAETIVLPTASDFQFTEEDYRTGNTLDATLKSIIESEIQKGGEGYSDEAETAAYEQEAERVEAVRQEAIDEVLAGASGSGFSMPQGHHIEAVRKINEKFRLDAEKKSGEVMSSQVKLSLENKWRALNAGISYNQIILAYFDTKAQRALDAAISLLSLGLFAIKYRTDMAKQALETGKAANKATMDKVRILIELYSIELLKYKKQADGLITMAKGYVEQYRVKGQTYGSSVFAAYDKSMLDQAENKLALENEKLNIIGFITSAEEALNNFVAASELKLGAATNGANMQKVIAMTTLASLGSVVNRIQAVEKESSE